MSPSLRTIRTAMLATLLASTALAQPIHQPMPTAKNPGDGPPDGTLMQDVIHVPSGQTDVSIKYREGATLVRPERADKVRQPEIINPAAGGEDKPFADSAREIVRTTDDEDYLDAPEVYAMDNGIRYVSGGLGEEGKAQMKLLEPDFRVKLSFAANTGHYLADVTVTIANTTGEAILSTTTEGPYLLVDLPKGAYTVTATYGDATQVKKVTVGDKGLRAYTITYTQPVM